MEADIVNLRGLFQTDVSYRIPSFQRPYAWEKPQWEALWSDVCDVMELCLENDAGEVRPHFLGAIVLKLQASNTGEVTKKLVVDGQQRLTTLQLLIKAAQDAFQSQDDTLRVERFKKLILNPQSHWGGDPYNETKIRQCNTYDQAAFQRAISGDYRDEQNQSWRISRAYKYLKKKTGEWLDIEPERRTVKADALEVTLTEHMKLAAIDLNQDDKPHLIFETLNTRGEQLKQSDLVKNTVMYEANVTDDAQMAEELWGMFDAEWWRERTSESRLSRIHIDRFLHYWMVMRTASDVTESTVASEFRRFVEENNELSIETIAAEIRNAGKVYRDLERGIFPGIETFLERIKVMDIGVVIPVVLWLCTSNVPSEQRRQSIEALESYLVRRMLCGFQTQGLNKVFISLLRELHSDGPAHANHTVIQYLNSQNVDNRLWPRDRMLHDRLIDGPMLRGAKRRKMILVAVENHLRGNRSEPLGPTDRLTIEHIMPQRWETNWPLPPNTPNRTEAEIIRNEAIETIGNITLITNSLNSSISNNPWEERREDLRNHSSLFLNRTLLDNAPEAWDEDAIAERCEYLAEKILQIWPSVDSFMESTA